MARALILSVKSFETGQSAATAGVHLLDCTAEVGYSSERRGEAVCQEVKGEKLYNQKKTFCHIILILESSVSITSINGWSRNR